MIEIASIKEKLNSFDWLYSWDWEYGAGVVESWLVARLNGSPVSPLIICGPKGSGKTLLARKLLKETTGDLTQIYQLSTASDKEEVFDAVARPGVVAIEADAATEGAKIKLGTITSTLYGRHEGDYQATLIVVTTDPAFTLKFGMPVYLKGQLKSGTYQRLRAEGVV